MGMNFILLCIGILFLVETARCQSSCFDLDPGACVSMLINDPNVCSNGGFAATACPETCGKCTSPTPLTCFHCDDFTSSFEECQQTKRCNIEEVCMSGSVTDIHTGEKKFTKRCASEEFCGGLSFLGAFRPTTTLTPVTKTSTTSAKPSTTTVAMGTDLAPTTAQHGAGVLIGRRDVETHCCLNSLCNRGHSSATTGTGTTASATATTVAPPTATTTKPTQSETTQTPGGHVTDSSMSSGSQTTNPHIPGTGSTISCLRDIVVGVGSPATNPAVSTMQLNSFLKSFINSIAIGANANLMSLMVLSEHLHSVIDLSDYQSQHILYNAVDQLNYNHAHPHMNTHDIARKLKEPLHRERPLVENALIIISDQGTTLNDPIAFKDVIEVQSLYSKIIVIDVGPFASTFDALATGPGYRLSISSYTDLPSVLNTLLTLLCK